MTSLYQKYHILLQHVNLRFKRYLYTKIAWNSRMIGIVGPRGVGKTTMVLQYIKEHLSPKHALYISADDIYFGEHTLFEVAEDFYNNAGEYLFIDEVHKYGNWSKELKNIYDTFPTLNLIFTGSSVLDILTGSADLSRRAVIYTLQGLSFREYLSLFHQHEVQEYSLEQMLNHEIKLSEIKHPLPLFKDYLKRGYYPFALESELDLRLRQIIVQTLEADIPQYANLNISTIRKLKHLLGIIAESVPFKPNFSKIAEMIKVSRNSLEDYFLYMERAGLISQLRNQSQGIRSLGKVDKVYLDNPNLIFHFSSDNSNIGNIRETFFINQMRVNHEVKISHHADFIINEYIFEVGGKNKSQSQIKNENKAFLVKDDIEYGYRNIIPLWAFGLNY